MKNFTTKTAKKHICNLVHRATPIKDFDMIDDGRIVIVTDLYFWEDGSIHDKPEPKEDNLPEWQEEIFFSDEGKILNIVSM